MLLEEVSLSSIPPDKRSEVIRRVLSRVKVDIEAQYAKRPGYVAGIRPFVGKHNRADADGWLLEWICGDEFERYEVLAVPQGLESATWDVHIHTKGPMSTVYGPISLSRALGALIGIALRKLICAVFMRPEQQFKVLRSAVEASIRPASLDQIALTF